MKKIFTSVLAVVLAIPAFAAKVDVKLYEGVKGATVSGTVTEISKGEYYGAYKNQEISYNESTDAYTFTNFLGYEKFDFALKLNSEKTQYKDGQIAIDVITEYGSDNEPALSERNSIAYTHSTSALSAYFNPEKGISSSVRMGANTGETRDALCYCSGVFEGTDKDYMVYQPRVNVIGNATNYNQTSRTYATVDGDKIILHLSATCYGLQRRDKDGDWSEYIGGPGSADENISTAQLRVFEIEFTKALEGMEGGETPEGTAVTVETWDDYKTTKVAEDFTGSLAYNNGEYTLSGIYGAADVDFRFKIGAYNEYTKKYAIEYLNTEEWKGYDYLFLLDKSGNHANIKPTAISGSDVPEAGINEVLIYNKSLYSYITKENDTYTMRIKYTGTDPDKNDYSSDYLMIFSWKDPEAVEPEVPEGDKVVINTFNSTLTTKVAEPSESALTYADGEYTVSALFGDANVDFKFKVGSYVATSDKYAIEFVNYEDYAGSYGYLLDKDGKHADIKPIAIGTSDVLEGGVREMLMYTKSSSSYIKKDNDTYTMYLKYSGYKGTSGYNYTNDYYMVFSWADPNAGVDGIEIDNENAPVEYYNLQGVKVENPAAGLYIRRQGKSVEKVVIK